eukprot:5814898-Alexandrium_andersonii.AAC.1
MSASLVGSEMCIRDSSGGSRPGGLRLATCALRPARSTRKPWGSPNCHPCLLYTSDAADDM